MAVVELTEISELMKEWESGNESAQEVLMEKIYEVLRRMAHQRMRNESENHTWSATELVHEAWMAIQKSVKDGHVPKNRQHLLNMFGKVMKHELINYAEYRNAQKRGGCMQTVRDIDLDSLKVSQTVNQYIEALKHLEEDHPELRGLATAYFLVGLSLEELADFLNISRATVVRRIRFAKAWLKTEYGVSQ